MMLTFIQFHKYVIQYGQQIGFEYSLFAAKVMYASYLAGRPTVVTDQIIAAFSEDIVCQEARNDLFNRISVREDEVLFGTPAPTKVKTPGHGTIHYYNQGCRCNLCGNARKEYWAKHKKERKERAA